MADTRDDEGLHPAWWTLILVRELLLGPKRFVELQRDIIGISPTVLSQRLRDLEVRGIAARHTLPAPARVDVYELTAWGLRLEAVNAALSMWAVGSPTLPRDADMSPDTLVLAMRAHARGDAALCSPHATTADWKACIIGGTPLSDLPNIRVTGRERAVDALVRATRLTGSD